MSDISREPLQNDVSVALGLNRAWRVVAADGDGNALIADSLSWELRFDYTTRTDGQPIYVGYAQTGSATDSPVWLIQKFTYDATDFVTRRQVVTDKKWDLRTTSF